MARLNFLCFLSVMALSFLASCGARNGNGHSLPEGDTIAMKWADNLVMVDYGDFVKADFRNPWDTAKVLQTYLLVPRGQELPAGLPAGVVVRTPIQKSVVYTNSHCNLLCELGCLDAIAGVCDWQYIYQPQVHFRVDNLTIANCGSSMAPNIERILQLKPDAILLSAYENSNDHNKVGQLGIPIVDCTDYMETSPLGRAEWMRFFGRLYGQGEKADSLFAQTEKEYLATKALMQEVNYKPLVLTELIYGQSWDVPAANSTVGVLIEDAGGRNPFEAYKRSGSVRLAPEEVLFRAKDADVWLVKYASPQPLTISRLGNENPIYAKFRPYDTGNVYGCDTNNSPYFEEAAFHPHWVLAELASIFHPEVDGVNPPRHYYHKLEK